MTKRSKPRRISNLKKPPSSTAGKLGLWVSANLRPDVADGCLLQGQPLARAGYPSEGYSTYDWVMDGLLPRAGFTIKSKQLDDGVLGTYICTKNQ